uniref:Uncharacterized protein n=1 Tax=Anopheles arabiensis TaxID=7173 RepID=A0A182IG68_ANOAR
MVPFFCLHLQNECSRTGQVCFAASKANKTVQKVASSCTGPKEPKGCKGNCKCRRKQNM